MTLELSVQIASLPDRESLVAEIWLGDQQVAEINSEGPEPILEIYPNPAGGAWDLPLESFVACLQGAIQNLSKGSSSP